MARQSAGLLLYRRVGEGVEFLLVHPGGPFWKNKDLGAWSIPKGEVNPGEDPLTAAQREFAEEVGFAPQGPFTALEPIRQPGGKLVTAWAVEGDCDPAHCMSNTFSIEWPPRSGKLQEFAEVDQAAFFTIDQARQKLNPAQLPLLQEVLSKRGLK